MAEQSSYDILGVPRDCSTEELTRSYRKLALMFHPDKNPDGIEQFKLITKAYKILVDPKARRMYDIGGESGVIGGFSDFSQRFEFSCKDFEDLLNWRPKARNVNSVHLISVSLEMIYTGGIIRQTIKKRILCTSCAERHEKICSSCGGKETIIKNELYEIQIKKGMCDGQEIVFIGEGDVTRETSPGDRIFQVNMEGHPVYSICGICNLRRTVEISFQTARNGGKILIETLDKRKLFFTVSSSSIRTGYKKCIRNEGMPDYFKPEKKGNLFLEFTIVFPHYLDQDNLQDLVLSAKFGNDAWIWRCKCLDKPAKELKLHAADEALLNAFPHNYYFHKDRYKLWIICLICVFLLIVGLLIIIIIHMLEDDD